MNTVDLFIDKERQNWKNREKERNPGVVVKEKKKKER